MHPQVSIAQQWIASIIILIDIIPGSDLPGLVLDAFAIFSSTSLHLQQLLRALEGIYMMGSDHSRITHFSGFSRGVAGGMSGSGLACCGCCCYYVYVYLSQSVCGMDAPQKDCYFCREVELRQCLTRSLYHKYNDVSDKFIDSIDILVSTSKNRSAAKLKYNQLQYILDSQENLTRYNSPFRATKEMFDLLEYYKFRKFVPVFVRSPESTLIIDSIYTYYYERLRLYYNSIKKDLNMTIDQSSRSEQSEDLLSISDRNPPESHLLGDLTPKTSRENIRLYESQSKAFENLLTVLKENQDRLKRIKTLKTEDCARDNHAFSDNHQRKFTKIHQVPTDTSHFAKKKRTNLPFFRILEDPKPHSSKISMQSTQFKLKFLRKSAENSHFNSHNTLSIATKNKRSENSMTKITKQEKRNLSRSKSKKKELAEEKAQHRAEVRSLPKAGIQFHIRSSRSTSTISLRANNKNQLAQASSHKLSSRALPPPIKTPPENPSPYQTIIAPLQGSKLQKKPKKSESSNKMTKNIGFIEIEQTDNIASVRRKKLEQLKLKSNRKKRESKGKEAR